MRLCMFTLIAALAGYGQPAGCKTCQTGQDASAGASPGRIPASVSGTHRDVDLADAWSELSDSRVVNEGFSLVNRANSSLPAYEVQWAISERSGDRRVFTAQTDSLGSPIAGPHTVLRVENRMGTGPSPLAFSKAAATLTYCELADGTAHPAEDEGGGTKEFRPVARGPHSEGILRRGEEKA